METLSLDGCPITEEADYRDDIFKMLPSLKYIDGKDPDGNDLSVENNEENSEEENQSEEDLESQEEASVQPLEEEAVSQKEDYKEYAEPSQELGITLQKSSSRYSNGPFLSQNLESNFNTFSALEYPYDSGNLGLGKRYHSGREELLNDSPRGGYGVESEEGTVPCDRH